MTKKPLFLTLLLVVILGLGLYVITTKTETRHILHVSYDPTRELYKDYNRVFTADYFEKTGQKLEIRQSHGGSGKQARAVIDGLGADVVSLALAYDIDVIAKKTEKLPKNWQSTLPKNSAPYTSTIVFLVRKGNPKNIHNWDDLIKPNIAIIAPNPKTSGAARWAYLAAWGYGLHSGKSDTDTKDFVAKVIHNIPVLDSGSRGATTTFVERGVGDVLLAWENEALLVLDKLGKNKFEIIYPHLSILAEPPVAIVQKNATDHDARELATAYLEGLYIPESQRIIAQHYYRPTDPTVLAEYHEQFPDMTLFRLEDYFGNWSEAQQRHFDDGGSFDQIFERK
jgi:sulfate/thiosulfate transport system substrate-binding protein